MGRLFEKVGLTCIPACDLVFLRLSQELLPVKVELPERVKVELAVAEVSQAAAKMAMHFSGGVWLGTKTMQNDVHQSVLN